MARRWVVELYHGKELGGGASLCIGGGWWSRWGYGVTLTAVLTLVGRWG